MIKIEGSSNINGVDLVDKETVGTLIVEFKNGKYKYENVPESLFEQFLNSESKGKFFNQNIKGKFNYTKIVE